MPVYGTRQRALIGPGRNHGLGHGSAWPARSIRNLTSHFQGRQSCVNLGFECGFLDAPSGGSPDIVSEPQTETGNSERVRLLFPPFKRLLAAIAGVTSNGSRWTPPCSPWPSTFPTDTKLLNAAINGLNRLARKCGVRPRQSYLRIAKRAAPMASRYAHAQAVKFPLQHAVVAEMFCTHRAGLTDAILHSRPGSCYS